ncbi:MAG: hypothetical protein A2275_00475 [Bacteroidetes bacterium RIFOXYA12_FULL_35_11]|nr:MAG: hypothetical protein A2X01_18530 [Bacteroidetes bacterium GWF2_35_48]OFY75301.1 MAG: hypothetical protein A2275_00475 [Bacteroidetes bacterium RIFOXYA12_FULL_35_11]OFY95849.1 MAG: hypothetical protein A2309_10485 [Bacteroidetes bacterium RIFOXYB2_FULL_35_7]OFY98425.1 MAG: hypothetical protein A2491_09775 [Bacteroidetes bacterium RIFOXYC12_FULL_35_7]
MTSTTETGHDKNVANLEDLISRCTGFGTAFNPSKAALKIPALNALQTSGRNVIQALKVAETAFDNATNTREIAFNPLKKLCTRIVNSLEVSGATKQTIADAITINRKVQGVRATPKKSKNALDAFIESTHKDAGTDSTGTTTTPVATEPKQISVSQQSYDSYIDHLTKLIQVISTEPLYTPNETELKVATLNTTLTNLKSTNTAVINATTTYSNALLTRNTTLYQPSTGLVDLALEVKKYVKSLFGATSPQYKQISKIAFRKYKF